MQPTVGRPHIAVDKATTGRCYLAFVARRRFEIDRQISETKEAKQIAARDARESERKAKIRALGQRINAVELDGSPSEEEAQQPKKAKRKAQAKAEVMSAALQGANH